jgi:ferredoxin
MSLSINAVKCQGHGSCAMVSPELFDVGDEGYGVVLISDPGPEYDDDVETAIGSCPEQAISRD